MRKQNPPLLIQAVKCQRREGSILLIFQWAKQEGVQLSLAPANLEAWLVTLHKLWVLAEWEDIWPQWINELSQAVKTETLKKMH